MAFQDKVQEAARLRRQYEARAEAIRQDRNLSPVGKRELIRKAYEETTEALRKLRQAAEAERQEERQSLLRLTFGPNLANAFTEGERQHIMDRYRQALDRAEAAATPDEALRLLRRATVMGDKTLARAIGWRAAEKGWHNVLDEVAASGAVIAAQLDELRAHVEADSPKAAFQRKVALAGPMRPPELDQPLPPEPA